MESKVISLVLTPAGQAFRAVDKVMKDNQAEKGDSWTGIPGLLHVRHAVDHLTAFLYEVSVSGYTPTEEDHLAHALTRIAMAITLRERQYDQPTL